MIFQAIVKQRHSADFQERIIGSLIAFSVCLTFVYWIYTDLGSLLSSDSPGICWPFLRSCESLHVFSHLQITAFLVVLTGISFLCGLMFYIHESFKTCLVFLGVISIIKYLVILFDYRLRLNQNYMAFWFTVCYFIFANSRPVLKNLLVMFYFFAGLIKLNPDWLNGLSLYSIPWPLDNTSVIAASRYVVVLEIILIWGLLSKNKIVFYLIFGQLIAFHLISFNVVGFFYPVLMLLFLLIFLIPEDNSTVFFEDSKIEDKRNVFILVFVLFQLVPTLSVGDPSVTGQGRLMALHMFDNNLTCQASLNIHFKNKKETTEYLDIPVAQRIKCDPIVYLHIARDVCSREKVLGIETVQLQLLTKKPSEDHLWKVIDIENFCKKDPRYQVLGLNDWISYARI